MPAFFPRLVSGVIKDDTELLSEGYYTDADRVRFRAVQQAKGPSLAMPQIIGGWEKATQDTFVGACRAMLGWEDLEGRKVVGVGTSRKTYAYTAGRLYDITPIRDDSATSGVKSSNITSTAGTVTLNVLHTAHGVSDGDMVYVQAGTAVGGLDLGAAGTLATARLTASELSAFVIVKHTAHGRTSGDFVEFAGASAVGGIGAADINTGHRVYTLNANNYLFEAGTPAGSTETGGGAPTYRYYDRFVATYVDDDNFSIPGPSAAASSETAGATVHWKFELAIGRVNAALSAGYSTGTYSAGYYSLPSTLSDLKARVWHLALFGQNLIGCYAESPLYRWENNYSQSMAAVAATDAPQKNLSVMVTPERFLVALGTEDAASSTYDPMQVAWATQEGGFSSNEWTPAATNTAGDIRLAEGTRIIRGLTMPFVSVIWTDTALYQMRYLADTTYIFGFELLGTECGLIGANAAVRTGDTGRVFWLSSTRRFFMWQGGAPVVLACPVREWLFAQFAPVQEDLIYAGHNPRWNEVWWFIPTREDNECAIYVAYNYVEGWWTVGTFEISAWHHNGDGNYPIATHTDGTIQLHEKGQSDNGDAFSWLFETAYQDIEDGENLMYVDRFVPDHKDLVGGATYSIKTKIWPQGDETTTSIGSVSGSTLYKTFRAIGRQVKIRAEGDSAPAGGRVGRWSFNVKPTGAKR
jgi:hypothetical protein